MKYYKGAKARSDDKGSFKHDNRNKPGTGQVAKGKIGSHKGPKYAKESLGAKDPVQAKLRKISKAMFQRRKATSAEGMMRAQLNA